MAKRDYPNNNFAWYNDDKRLAIVSLDTTSTPGERTKERYDSYQDSDVTGGIRVVYHSKYSEANSVDNDLTNDCGIDSGLHNAILCYVKSRLYEDLGDFKSAQYFRQMYDIKVKRYPLRKSGVRSLSVPRL